MICPSFLSNLGREVRNIETLVISLPVYGLRDRCGQEPLSSLHAARLYALAFLSGQFETITERLPVEGLRFVNIIRRL